MRPGGSKRPVPTIAAPVSPTATTMRTHTHRPKQRRGWTPQALADALRSGGYPGSRATLQRACQRGDIPHVTTDGGHRRICPAWVAETFPGLALPEAA